jgi:hypothetical protein
MLISPLKLEETERDSEGRERRGSGGGRTKDTAVYGEKQIVLLENVGWKKVKPWEVKKVKQWKMNKVKPWEVKMCKAMEDEAGKALGSEDMQSNGRLIRQSLGK